MGELTERIYLDTAPLIYLIENVTPYATTVELRLSEPHVVQVVSDLTRMECRIKPLRDANMDLLKDFDDYFAEAVSQVVPLFKEVIDQATEIRAIYGFKTPDAIHLAAALVAGCTVFLTNDHRLTSFAEIVIEVVDQDPD
jgi:uncharacterized protein